MVTNINRMELQSKEFNALNKLHIKYCQLPAIVDDDYPEARHYYESALKAFIDALKNNGKI